VKTETAAETNEAETAGPLHAITEALRGLRFGSVNIVVQDGVIVQIERIEKRRLTRPSNSKSNC
jgi:hypothetical protein